MDDIIKFYFHKGYQYEDIVIRLAESHNMQVSVRTLKRHLHRLGLRRKPEVTTALLNRASNVVDSELRGPGKYCIAQSQPKW